MDARDRAAEPRPTVPRNARRVIELMEECFAEAARRSEPDWLSDFMLGSMSRPEAASIQKLGFHLCPILTAQALALPFRRVLFALLSKVQPIEPADKA